MKRIVICCDGTWNRPDDENVTNIEKIARTVETDAARTDGVQQLVHYQRGVGTSTYVLDRMLGGAFGFGLFRSVIDAYRFLALNYSPGRPGEPDDEIYVFGFSRGAYTARSLVGMVGKVGLLTSTALIEDRLPEAVARYRGEKLDEGEYGDSIDEFKRDHCHKPMIRFLGVFDTVGALGVPGAIFNRHKFHDVLLSDAVTCARHALSIDDRRMKFEPALWRADGGGDSLERVKQVWFEGYHSDIGGGGGPEADSTGLSDTALLWMVREANSRGLAFNEGLLDNYIGSRNRAIRHDSMRPFYRLLNGVARVRGLFKPNASFRGNRRVMNPPGAINALIASSAADHFAAGEADYRPLNVEWFAASQKDGSLAAATEEVVALPDKSVAVLHSRLEAAGVDLGSSPTGRAQSPLSRGDAKSASSDVSGAETGHNPSR